MSASPTVIDALAGARYQAPALNSRRSVLVAGAASRLGERVLARALGTQEYQHIFVLAAEAIPSTESKLTALTQSDWAFGVDHVIAVVGDGNPDASRRKRTDVFSTLSVDEVLPLALRAKSLGVSRFMLVTPTNVLAQPSAIYAQLANLMESDLHEIGFDSLVLVRPSDHEIRQRQLDLGRRLIAMVVDTATGLMTGLKHVPLSLEDTARAVVRALLDSAQGLQIIETDKLHQILKS